MKEVKKLKIEVCKKIINTPDAIAGVLNPFSKEEAKKELENEGIHPVFESILESWKNLYGNCGRN